MKQQNFAVITQDTAIITVVWLHYGAVCICLTGISGAHLPALVGLQAHPAPALGPNKDSCISRIVAGVLRPGSTTAGNAVPANAAHSRGDFTMSVSLSGIASPGPADVNAVLISRIAPRGSVTLAQFPADERRNAQRRNS